MTSEDDSLQAVESDRSLLGHPKGLAILFLTEMWERFSFYGMRSMLVTYLLWHFLRSETASYGIYAAYAGMLYLMPLIGGYLADTLLGTRKAIVFGAILITCGHFAMTVEGAPGIEAVIANSGRFEMTNMPNPEGDTPQFVRNIMVDGQSLRVRNLTTDGTQATVTYVTPSGATAMLSGRIERRADPFGENMMFLALALIIVGTGFLKANISAVVGSLYKRHDPRRDSGFTIFYMGINLGALMGIGSVGYIGIKYGWSYGFGLAGIGMLAGLVIFLTHQDWLQGAGDPPDPAHLKAPCLGPVSREWCVYIASILSVGVAWLIVKYLGQIGLSDVLAIFGLSVQSVPVIGKLTLFDLLVNLVFIFSMIAVAAYSLSRLERDDRDRMMVLVVLIFVSVIFWTLFEQAPISLLVFQMRFVDTGIFTPQQIGLFNPVFILMFGPVFIYLWRKLGERGLEPSTPFKFAYGLVLIGAGYLVLCLGIGLSGSGMVLGIIWIALLYFLHTMGELCLSPVGLSAVTKLALPRLVGFMMGTWFLSMALAEVLASLVSKATVVSEGSPPAVAMAQFETVFLWLGIVSVAGGVLIWFAGPRLKAMMHGRG